MRYFTVTIHAKRIEIEETFQPYRIYDYKAVVDGDAWLYLIKRHKNNPDKSNRWRMRATQQVFYHAFNSGTHVRFEPVSIRRPYKRKISEKQLSFLAD